MTSRSRGSGNRSAGATTWRALRTLLTMVLLAVVGCAQRDSADDGQRVERETPWQETIAQAKAFTYRIGFVPTANFTHASADLPGFPYCGRASKLVLPYSYEDPAIEWLDVATPEQCRDIPPSMESYHGMSEAVGEVASPVTPSMIASGVPRMIYLVVHEDCHDQFTLPYGIEEPLCELLSYRAMTEMAAQPGPWSAAERRAIREYALHNASRIPLNLHHYQQVAALHERHARGEVDQAGLLRARAVLLSRAEAATGSPAGSLNNIVLANRMTYARHYAAIERAFERVGSDLGRLVALFQQVDARILAASVLAAETATDAGPAPVEPTSNSGPRQRPSLLPRTAPAGRNPGDAKARPPQKPAGRPPATGSRPAVAGVPPARTPAEVAAAEPVAEDPAALLARIRAAEATALEVAARLLDAR